MLRSPSAVFVGVMLIVCGAYWLLVVRDEEQLLERLQPQPTVQQPSGDARRV